MSDHLLPVPYDPPRPPERPKEVVLGGDRVTLGLLPQSTIERMTPAAQALERRTVLFAPPIEQPRPAAVFVAAGPSSAGVPVVVLMVAAVAVLVVLAIAVVV